MPPTDELSTLRAEVERLRAIVDLLLDNESRKAERKLVPETQEDGSQWFVVADKSGEKLYKVWNHLDFLVAAGRWEQHPEMGWLYRRKETK